MIKYDMACFPPQLFARIKTSKKLMRFNETTQETSVQETKHNIK